MNILIIGGGMLGRKTAELLDTAGHTVAILDESTDNLSLLDPSFSGVTDLGFPMDLDALRGAGIEGCDAVAVVTSDDSLNITVGQIARNYFHVPKVVARISDPRRESVFAGFGLETICPTNMAGERLASALTNPKVTRQAAFGDSTISLTARPIDRRYIGRTTDDLEVSPGDGVLGVLRDNGQFLLLPHRGSLELTAGDCVVYSRKID